MADDRSETFRAMGVRYRLRSTLAQLGTEPNILQISLIQDCIELAKLNPDTNTNQIIQDAFNRTKRENN
jgi:hypothetical protein